MGKYKSFEELKRDCKGLVEMAKKRGAYVGIKKLLTELYPDKAHFIYELLQNAEDMWATEVIFTLTSDMLIFEHNGTKRDFTLDDISAITNIAESPKRDDPTSIGQFGVGFKAVYAYTNTPEIHSGEYDFKIVDMLIPEDEGVLKSARKGATQFVFPLGNETKDKAVALQEIETGLLSLDENAILFLSHIKKIRYKLSNGNLGSITYENGTESREKIITVTKPDRFQEISHFLKFDKEISVEINGEKESRNISIAYRMIESEDLKYSFDQTLKGKVCIYFPAEKENHNLRFHINAPFASTVARDGVRDCPENNVLMNQIADLVCESIDWIKNNGLWDRSIYSVMTHSHDSIDRNSILWGIKEKILNKFSASKLMLIDNSNQQLFVSPKECVQLGQNIARVFKQVDIKKLDGHNYILAAQPGTNENYFFNDLSINVINESRFIKLLKDKGETLSKIIETKDVAWICSFYSILNDIIVRNSYDGDFLRDIEMIPSAEGELYTAKDKIYIASNYVPKNIVDTVYVNASIVANDKSRRFITEVLKVQEMSSTVDILEEINSGNSNKAIRAILEDFLCAADKEEFRKRYCEECIFQSINSYTKSFEFVKASDCCWDETVAFFYENERTIQTNSDEWNNRFRVKCANVIAINEYKKIFSENDIKSFKSMFELLGGKVAPVIESCDVEENPECEQWIQSHAIRKTKISKNDWTITGIDRLAEIESKRLFNESLMLWKIVTDPEQAFEEQYFRGYYRPSENGKSWEGESRLVRELKKKSWIPNKNGEFCLPCEVQKNDLFEEFVCTEVTPLMRAIGFGDKTQKIREIKSNIKQLCPDASEEQQEAIIRILENPDFAKSLVRKESKKGDLSLTEALEKQNRSQKHEEEEDSYGEKIGVKNPDSRQTKLQKIFENGLKNPYKRNASIHYTYNDNTSQEEKYFIFEEYRGKCQFCGIPAIKKYDGKSYFIAVNIVKTNYLKDELLTDIKRGWNTLCLCPSCAAKYAYCSKDMSTFISQVLSTNVKANDEELIAIKIELQEQNVEIKFTPKHFLALKAAVKTYCK